MAGIDDLKKSLDEIKARIEAIKSQGINVDTRSMEESLKRAQSQIGSVGTESKKTAEAIGASNSVIVSGLGQVNTTLAKTASAILEAGRGATDYGNQFKNAVSGTILDSVGKAVTGFDELTQTTRGLRTSAIDVGSAFGLGFEQTKAAYGSYIQSILIAQNNTYENRQAIQDQTKALAQLGIGLNEITKTFDVAGTKQNFLSEGFLLASETGMRTDVVFNIMAQSARTMGLSVEDAAKPLIGLENIARATGLPLSELTGKTFDTVQQFSRLGLTVDGMAPILRRFTDVLGDGFKGLAVKEVTSLVEGLGRQVNTTQAAFIAMQGGLARPGAGVAEAQLAFEDAFKNPVDIMRSLTTTLGGITGGKIIKFEEARANPELANQFKIQRDLLQQLTGNTDPQSQRTLMSILADLQSGRQLTATQNKTLEDSLKSGTQKQEETHALADRIGKAQVGLLTTIALNISAFAEKVLPAQAQAGMINKGKEFVEDKGAVLFNKALEMGSKLLENNLPDSVKKVASGAVEAHAGFMNAQEASAAHIRKTGNITVPQLTLGATNAPVIPAPTIERAPIPQTTPTAAVHIPAQAAPRAQIATGPVVNNQLHTGTPSNQTTQAPAPATGQQQFVVTFRGTDRLGKAIADAASAAHNEMVKGGG